MRRRFIDLVALVVIAFALGAIVAPRVAQALSTPIPKLQHLEPVAVPASGTAGVLLGVATQKSIVCQIPDGTAACIRVGGEDVTATAGLRYGVAANGCVGGQVISMDVQVLYAVSEGAAVNLDCGYGQ